MKSTLPDGRVVVQLSSLNLPANKMLGLTVFHPPRQTVKGGPIWAITVGSEWGQNVEHEVSFDFGPIISVRYGPKKTQVKIDATNHAHWQPLHSWSNVWVLETDVPSLWEIDAVQFPRLLVEIDMETCLTDAQYTALSASMDLGRGEINDLFERAHKAWEGHKKKLLPG